MSKRGNKAKTPPTACVLCGRRQTDGGALCDDCRPDYNIVAEFNHRRIVACVNACAGLGTEALESGVLEQLFDLIRETCGSNGPLERSLLAKLEET